MQIELMWCQAVLKRWSEGHRTGQFLKSTFGSIPKTPALARTARS